MTEDKYCGDCMNIEATPFGSYCVITGKNIDRQSYYSHEQKDENLLLRHCTDQYKMCDCELLQSCEKCKQ